MDEDAYSEDDAYVVVQIFRTSYSARCNLEDSHKIKRDDLVGRLQRTDNPLIPVSGIACKHCIKTMKRFEA